MDKQQTASCPKLVFDECSVMTGLGNVSISPTPEECAACRRSSKPMTINEITICSTVIKLKSAGLEVPGTLEASCTSQPHSGPGTVLKYLISWFVTKPLNCACEDRADIMNAWGVEGCNQNIPQILGWLRESALDNNIRYSEFWIACMVRLAITLARFHITR